MSGLEKDLVHECELAAKAMGAFLAKVGQRRAKGSGTTKGFPDLVLLCAGHVVLIEVKRPELGCLSLGQTVFIERAAEQGVKVHVVDTLDDFVRLVNGCRRGR